MSKKFIFEHHREPLLSRWNFVRRMAACALISLTLLVSAAALGAWGYYHWEHENWLDAMLNSVMIMTGLGLENPLITAEGKRFTIVFSFLSAFAFYSALGILFTPIIHRLLHRFHLEKHTE
jgi:hypothetical protein